MEAKLELNPSELKQRSSARFFGTDGAHHSAGSPKFCEEGDDDPSGFRVLVKHLRGRRIFSPNPRRIHQQEDLSAAANTKAERNCGAGEENEELGKLDPIEERVQTTPPEAVEVFGHSGDGISRDGDRGLSMESCIGRTSHSVSNYRSGPPMCVRGRLFRPPSSFSYRRLLPYLMDLSKENDSGTVRTCKIQNPETGMGEKLLQQVSDPSQEQCLVSAATFDAGESKRNEGLGKLNTLEEQVQTTLPEAVDTFYHCGEGIPDNADRSSFEKSSMGRTSHSVSSDRSGPPLCVRGRLFKPPSSFGYRRLLPYLMDIAKENDSVPGIVRTCKIQNPKTGMGRKLLQKVSAPSQNQCLVPAAAPAVVTAMPVHLKMELSPCTDVSHASMNEDSCEIGKSCGDGGIIGNASTCEQVPEQLDPRNCMDTDFGELSNNAKVAEKGEADEDNVIPCSNDAKLFERRGSYAVEKVIPVDTEEVPLVREEYDEASMREQPCSRSCDYGIDSSNVSNSRASTAEGNVVSPVSNKASGVTEKSSNETINEIKNSGPEDSKTPPKRTKMVLHPCTRSKLFKSPNSFSYRRFLPYLKEIDKEAELRLYSSAGTMGKTQHQEPVNICKGNLNPAPMSSNSPKPLSDVPVMNGGDAVLLEDSTQYGFADCIAVHPMDSKRGILKRNPRGCRGLCPCLNCASFRLNAERAFEFSRNQMKDAEEVALDLMKETSYLRSLLQRISASATIPDNEVLEACRKASEAEVMAKKRLSEMNEDLNIHCRVKTLHRPKVMFERLCAEDQSV